MAKRLVLINLVNTKLAVLYSYKDEVHGKLDTYIDKVSAMATSAVDDDGQDINSIREMHSKVETVLELLLELGVRIEEGSRELSASDSSPTVTFHPVSVSLSELPLDLPQRNFGASGEMEARLQRLEKTVENLATETAETEKRQSLSFNNIQEKISDLEILNPKLGEKLQKLEDQVQEIKTKTLDPVKQQELRFRAMEDLINQIDTKFSAKIEEMDSATHPTLSDLDGMFTNKEKQFSIRMDDFDNKMKQLDKNHDDALKQNNSRVDTMEKRLKKLEAEGQKESSRLDSLAKKIHALRDEHRKEQRPSSEFLTLEERMMTLTSQYCSLEDQIKDVQQLKQTTDNLATRMNTLADRGDPTDVLKTSRTVTSSLEDLSSRVESVEKFVQSSDSYREKEENKRRELEDRILVVEANRAEDLELYTKKMEEVESLFKQVCALVDLKVEPLRRLQRILNDFHKKVEKRQELSLRLDEVTNQVQDISRKVQTLGTSTLPTTVGFTANCQNGATMNPYGRSNDFRKVTVNDGGHYDPTTGTFTAPTVGLYKVSVTLKQIGDGEVHVSAVRNETHCVCEVVTIRNDHCSRSTDKVRMKAGDTLSVKLVQMMGCPMLSDYSSFSCFLLG